MTIFRFNEEKNRLISKELDQVYNGTHAALIPVETHPDIEPQIKELREARDRKLEQAERQKTVSLDSIKEQYNAKRASVDAEYEVTFTTSY